MLNCCARNNQTGCKAITGWLSTSLAWLTAVVLGARSAWSLRSFQSFKPL